MTFTETQPGVWFDETQQYRISISRLVQELTGRVVYYSAVLCERIGRPEDRYWALCGAHRPYKSMAAAQRAIKKHRRLWVSAIRAGRRQLDREANLERIKRRGHVGMDRTRNFVFSNLPIWVRERAPEAPERMIAGYRRLCKHAHDGRERASSSPAAAGTRLADLPSQEKSSSPALPTVLEPGQAIATMRRAVSRETRCAPPSNETPESAPVKEHASRACKRAARSSPRRRKKSRTAVSRRPAKRKLGL